jgi:osmotically-inducible protein OsmY
MIEATSAAQDEPVQYLVARIRDALAHDERVAALDIGVRVVGTNLFLTGVVATPERADAAAAVVAPLIPDYTVHNQLVVTSANAPTTTENLR